MNEQSKQAQKRKLSTNNTFAAPRVIQSAFFGILFSAAIFITVIGSLQAISGDPEQIEQVDLLLSFNLALILALSIYLIFRVWRLLFAKKVRRSAPLLQRRFVMIFSLAALVPAILVGAFSTSMISRNINDLFGENVRTTLNSANQFLNDYLVQEITDLVPSFVATKKYLERNDPLFDNRISYQVDLNRFVSSLDVDAAFVINREGVIHARYISPRTPEGKTVKFLIPTKDVFDFVDQSGRPAVQSRDEDDYLTVFAKLDGDAQKYLVVGQFLRSDSTILSSISGIKEAGTNLNQYNDNQEIFRKIFFLVFLESALLILIAAVWLGIILANRIIEPLGTIVQAAEKVRDGDLSARVAVRGEWGEISDLGSAFNRMTRQLHTQRDDLVREHDISERRRQFSEAVLSGVRAGVIVCPKKAGSP